MLHRPTGRGCQRAKGKPLLKKVTLWVIIALGLLQVGGHRVIFSL